MRSTALELDGSLAARDQTNEPFPHQIGALMSISSRAAAAVPSSDVLALTPRAFF